MPSLSTRIRRFGTRHDLWTPRTRVIAGVSGGSDSVALLLLLRELSATGALSLAGAAHVHHHLRPEADEDERFVRALAGELGVALHVAHADVPAEAARDRQSIEVAARDARHRCLAEAARAMRAERIATAHTLNDQAETVLMRLVRGAGTAGLGAMDPRRGVRIRPLLDETRETLRAWLQASGRTWREDPSNADLTQPRNRIRHELLPYLARHFNPSVTAALARAAEIAREDERHLAAVASEAAASLLTAVTDGAALDAAGLAFLPPAIGRRVARTALETAHPGRSYGLEEVEVVRAACAGSEAPRALPGVRMERNGPHVVLVHGRSVPNRTVRAFHYDLGVPGQIHVAEAGVVLEAEGPVPGAGLDQGPGAVAVDAAALGGRLVVRSREPGDWLRPMGLGGRKKLQDLFVDRKVTRAQRDKVPIVTDPLGRIVWVAGHALAEEFRVTSGTNAVVVLRLRPF